MAYPEYRDYQIDAIREKIGEKEYNRLIELLLNREIYRLVSAIQNPRYAYSRAGINATGGPSGTTNIYHTDEKSPTGVSLAASGDSFIADYLIKLFRNNSPLSPPERK